jgi:hypothetical protein
VLAAGIGAGLTLRLRAAVVWVVAWVIACGVLACCWRRWP